MTYPETIKYLESFIDYEKAVNYPYKESLKLERIQGFLAAIGNPQNSLRCIHVAGTKGKGSTCAFLAYILRQAGFRIGLYTSPHLSDFRERIRILNPKSKILNPKQIPALPAGRPNPKSQFEGLISKNELNGLVERLKPAVEKYNQNSKYGPLTFFELYTALAFVYFKEKKVDFAVLETGLGGRLDATNTVNPLVSVITPISYEHTQKLGNTLREIATEKAGIIKSQITNSKSQTNPKSQTPIIITAPQKKEAKDVIRKRCRQTGARLCEVSKKTALKYKIPLIGEHQLVNAAVAIKAIEVLKNFGIRVSADNIRRGIEQTVWPGRCEIVSRHPLVVLDGAQNVASAEALKKAIKKNFKYKKLFLVLGISQDKDIKGLCAELKDLADMVILTKADNPRATKPEFLAGYFPGKVTYLTGNTKEALALARRLSSKQDLILVTGSLFVVGELRDAEV